VPQDAAAGATGRQTILHPEYYRLIFDTSHLGILTTDPAGNFLDANPAFCRMLGFTLDEMLHKNISTLTHPDDISDNLRVRAEVMAGREGSEIFEKRYLHKSGASVWARLVGSPIRDEQGKVVALFAMVENINERKLSETELRRMQGEIVASEQRLRYITRASLDLIWDWDLVSRAIWWGEGLQTLFGFDMTMMGNDEKFWLSRAHPDDAHQMRRAYREVIKGHKEGWNITFRVCKLNGEYLPVEERAFALRDAEGKVLRIVGGVTDISARQQLEEQLRQAQRLESIGQLTGGVAHDFNNLLTVMLGNAELLAARLHAEPDLLELADAIVRAALQGSDLTHRLLAFARRQALEPKNVSLNHLVENMSKILRRTLGEDISLKLYPADGLWLCEVDPNQMEAAILNLCINARDAMPDGGELLIETANVHLDESYANRQFDLQSGDYACISISDSGSGIAPENLEHVLEPFFTTKPKGKGTGLGLSTIFGFIKQSRGHMNLYSELQQGTTVKLYLPRSEAAAVEHERQRVRAVVISGRETILLVEDDELVRQYAETQLQSLGYRVLSAANGKDALALINAHPEIDLLFTDVVMPGGMGGRQLAETARSLRPDLKVLYTSGYTENSIVHNGRLDPGVQLLGKPYQRHELAGKLRTVLDGN
jgi:PAS domain S-box-containing protein